jgi:hypothetical protein
MRFKMASKSLVSRGFWQGGKEMLLNAATLDRPRLLISKQRKSSLKPNPVFSPALAPTGF